jgi:hypothetical protein
MSEAGRGWRVLPAPLLLGLCLRAAHVVGTMLLTVLYQLRDHSPFEGPPSWTELVQFGTDVTASTLLAYGAIELARRHTTGARRAVQIAAFGWVAMVVLALVWFSSVSIGSYSLDFEEEHRITLQRHAWYAAIWLPIIGLAVGAWLRRHRAIAVGSLAVILLVHPPSLVWRLSALGYRTAVVLSLVSTAVQFVVLVVLAMTLAAHTTAPPEPEHAPRGLRRAAMALRFRVIAAVVAGLIGIFAVSQARHTSTTMNGFAAVAGAAITCVAFGWLAVGVLGASRGLSGERYRLAFAGATSMWCCAVTSAKLLCLYKLVYGTGVRNADRIVGRLTFVVPLLEIVSLAVLITTIAAVASERGLMKLYEDAFSRKISIVFMLLVADTIQVWGMPIALEGSPGLALLAMFVVLICWISALSMASQLCRTAAEALEQEPTLPSARLLESASS